MSRLIHVAQVMGHMSGGGVEATIMNHYRHIDRSRVQFDFVIDSDSTIVPKEEIEQLGGHVFIVPPYKRLPSYMKACVQLFKKIKPDIVHSNINTLSVFPLMAARFAGVPVRIAHCHTSASHGQFVKNMIENILRLFSRGQATHFAACSVNSGEWLFGHKMIEENRVNIIKNAIDLRQFQFNNVVRIKKRAELSLAPNQLAIGQVGRFTFTKNHMFTLNIFREIVKIRPDAMLFFSGDGELRPKIEEKIHEFGLERNVHLLGQRNDVAELYQAFDVMAFPSYWEGLPLTVVEAQASDLPVVLSDTVSNDCYILSDLLHPLSLKTNLNRWRDEFLTSADRQKSIRHSRIQEISQAGFDIDVSAQNLCSWYEKICQVESD